MMSHLFDPRSSFLPSVSAPLQPQNGQNNRRASLQAAEFLVALKHNRSVTPEPGNVPSSDSERQRVAVQHAQSQPQSQLRDMPLPYPAVGSVYGFPTRFEQNLIDRPAPPLMDETNQPVMSWDLLLGDSKLVLLKDRDLVPDSLFVAMAQMKPCKLTQADRVGCYKSREIGFIGMCCKHCGGQPGFGRYYPNSVRSLAQTTTSQTILKHIGNKCRFCPPNVRQAVLDLQRQQAVKEGMASGRPRYGSRKIFFQRMWARLHGKREEDEENDEDSKVTEDASASGAEPASAVSSDASDAEDEEGERVSNHVKRKNAEEEREGKKIRLEHL